MMPEIIPDAQEMEFKKAVLDAKNVVCECGCKTFVPGYFLKKISSLYTGTGKEELVEIPVWICSKCGAIPKEVKEKANYSKLAGEESLKQIVSEFND